MYRGLGLLQNRLRIDKNRASARITLALGAVSLVLASIGGLAINLLADSGTSHAEVQYVLDISSDATIGMNVDDASVDFGELVDTDGLSQLKIADVMLTTNSVAGYTLVQTFNDAASSEATKSDNSTDPARGITKWMPTGKMLLNGTDEKHTGQC